MARHNPLGKIKDLTVEALKTPTKVAGKAVGQARGAAAAGLHVADHVTRSAVATAGALVQQRGGGTASPTPAERGANVTIDPEEPVNVVEELGLDPAPVDAPGKKGRKPAKKAATRATTSIDAEADASHVDATPADVAEKVARKAPGRKTAATKGPAKKAPAKKAATTKAPAKKAATKAAKTSSPSGKLPPRKKPLSAAELADGAGPEVITPVGTRGAGAATNPDTTDGDLQQVDTEPLMDPATTKAVASEQATLSAAADTDKS